MTQPPSDGEQAGETPLEFESWPLTRQEYISAMVHFYRAELTRANAWRLRLDTSTNWAVLASMGLISFAFGDPAHSHVSILFAIVLVMYFLVLEARRYRFFDLWRYRVRLVEENFYGPIVARELDSPDSNWGKLIEEDLLKPEFKITYWQAFRSRFVTNYASLFLILLAAWIVKLMVHPGYPREGLLRQMAIGPIPGYVPLAIVSLVYLSLLAIVIFVSKVDHPDLVYVPHPSNGSHVDF